MDPVCIWVEVRVAMGCHTGKRDTRGGTAGWGRWRRMRGHATQKVGSGSGACAMYKDTGGQGRRRVRKASKNYVWICHKECFVC